MEHLGQRVWSETFGVRHPASLAAGLAPTTRVENPLRELVHVEKEIQVKSVQYHQSQDKFRLMVQLLTVLVPSVDIFIVEMFASFFCCQAKNSPWILREDKESENVRLSWKEGISVFVELKAYGGAPGPGRTAVAPKPLKIPHLVM